MQSILGEAHPAIGSVDSMSTPSCYQGTEDFLKTTRPHCDIAAVRAVSGVRPGLVLVVVES